MDTQTFSQDVEQIASAYNIGNHPPAQLVHDGKATKIKQWEYLRAVFRSPARRCWPACRNTMA